MFADNVSPKAIKSLIVMLIKVGNIKEHSAFYMIKSVKTSEKVTPI